MKTLCQTFAALVALALLAACRPVTTPAPLDAEAGISVADSQDNAADCTAFCSTLRMSLCPEGLRASCVADCTQVENGTEMRLPIACVVAATTVAEIRDCGAGETVSRISCGPLDGGP